MRDGNLYGLFRKHLSHFLWTRIEVGSLNRGIPDTNYLFQGIEGWIEFKAVARDKLDIRPEQIGHIIDRIRHGGIVRVAVRRDEELLIFDGIVVRDMRHKTLSDNNHHLMGYWDGGPKNWNWKEIHTILVTRVGENSGNGHDDE